MAIVVPSGKFRRKGVSVRRISGVSIRRNAGVSVRRDGGVTFNPGAVVKSDTAVSPATEKQGKGEFVMAFGPTEQQRKRFQALPDVPEIKGVHLKNSSHLPINS